MNAFKNINRKKSLKLALFAGALVLISLIVFSMIEKSDELDRKLAKAREKLGDITAAAERYTAISKSAPPAFHGSPSANLTLEVERLARKSGLGKSIEKISPKQGGKELTLSIAGVELYSFVDFLKNLKLSPSGIIVKRAVVKRSFEKKDKLEVSLTLIKGF